jgi:hypothetical protein
LGFAPDKTCFLREDLENFAPSGKRFQSSKSDAGFSFLLQIKLLPQRRPRKFCPFRQKVSVFEE